MYLPDCKVGLPRHAAVHLPVRPQRGIGLQMSESVVIGVDGGGSKSLASVVSLKEPNLVLSAVKSGPCNGYEIENVLLYPSVHRAVS